MNVGPYKPKSYDKCEICKAYDGSDKFMSWRLVTMPNGKNAQVCARCAESVRHVHKERTCCAEKIVEKTLAPDLRL